MQRVPAPSPARPPLHDGTTGLAALDLLPRLLDVVLGRRALVGVRAPLPATIPGALHASPGLVHDAGRAPLGAVDITPALGTLRDDAIAHLRNRAWYAASKSTRTDLHLLALRALHLRADRVVNAAAR